MAKQKLYEDIPLPGLESIQEVHHTGEVHAMKTLKTKGTAYCPSCCRWNTRAALGVLESNGHLIYRDHVKRTYSGATIPCPTSGVRLCQSKPILRSDAKITQCSCE